MFKWWSCLTVARIATLLLLSVASGSASDKATAGKENLSLLEQLCQLQKPTVGLTRVAQVKALVAELKQAEPEFVCYVETERAIIDLGAIVEAESMCTLDTVDRINRFHMTYVYKKSPLRGFLPATMRDFFLGYAFTVSKVCKESLMDALVKVGQAHITADDFEVVTNGIANADTIEDFVGPKMKLVDLFLVVDLSYPARPGADHEDRPTEGETVALTPGLKVLVDDLQSRCRNKFKPIYDQLMVPIIKLAYLGFNYEDSDIGGRMDRFRQSDEYRHWYKAVFVCQSMLRVRTVVLPEDEEDATAAAAAATTTTTQRDADGNPIVPPVTILMEGETNEVAGDGGGGGEESSPGEPAAQSAEQQTDSSRPIEFKRRVHLDPEYEIIRREDRYLMDSIERFNIRRKELDRVRARMIKKIPELLRIYLRTGHIRFGRQSLSDGERKEMIKSLSNYGMRSRSFWAPSSTRKAHRVRRVLLYSLRLGMVGMMALAIASAIIFAPIHALPYLSTIILLAGVVRYVERKRVPAASIK